MFKKKKKPDPDPEPLEEIHVEPHQHNHRERNRFPYGLTRFQGHGEVARCMATRIDRAYRKQGYATAYRYDSQTQECVVKVSAVPYVAPPVAADF